MARTCGEGITKVHDSTNTAILEGSPAPATYT